MRHRHYVNRQQEFSHSLPGIRACIFDMDGLLINSEDVITKCTNELLEKYGRPVFTRSMRAVTMGVPDSTNSDVFHDWAKLPIPRNQFKRELKDLMTLNFADCEPLPGAEKLLSDLSHSVSSGAKVELALASSTKSNTYKVKISKPRNQRMLDFFEPNRRILGDDPRVQQGRGKPAPDIYLVALKALNSSINPDQRPIMPNECLVFEDSIAGVESGRRAGMRVIWVPHPDLATEYQSLEKEILAGRSGRFTLEDESHLGEIDDGWAESIPRLDHFDFGKYGIQLLRHELDR
ncbi:HAD-like domain-containing protein [Xylariaceae sp. FL0255]|nr:HAD-like domain-containing protein [Xylariaceae sp. FL0255]